MKSMQAPLVGALLVLVVLAGCTPRQLVKSKASGKKVAAKPVPVVVEPPIDTNTVQGAEMVMYDLRPSQYAEDLSRAKEYIRDYYLHGTMFNPDTCTSFGSLLDSLDPQTFYLSQARYKSLFVQPDGSCTSAGFEVDPVDEAYCAVSQVVYGGPAWKAGLAFGDIIRVVDKTSCRYKTTSEVMELISRKATPLDLLVWRVINNDTVAVSISIDEGRAPNQYVPPAVMLPGNIGIIQVNKFEPGIASAVRKQILGLVKSGMKQLILDLRSNSGGYVAEAHCLASQFLPPGAIVQIEKGKGVSRFSKSGRSDSVSRADFADTIRAFGKDVPEKYMSWLSPIIGVEGGSFLSGDMIVLINEGTASASEIVAGALRYNKRAILLGSPSYGKGRIQRPMPLPNKGFLYMTIGEYTAGDGRRIDKFLSKDSVGLIPDVVVGPSMHPVLSDELEAKIDHEVASWFTDLGQYRRSLDSCEVLPHQLCTLYGKPLYRDYLWSYAYMVYGSGLMIKWHSESQTVQLAWQTLMNMRPKPAIAKSSTTLKRIVKRKR